MSRIHNLRFIRFFLVATLLVGLLHYYLGVRLLPLLPFGQHIKYLGAAWLLFSTLAIPLAMLSRFLVKQQKLLDIFSWLGLTAMGLFSTLLVLTILRDLVLWISSWFYFSTELDVFTTSSVVWIWGLSLLATIIGFINVTRAPAIVEIKIPLKNLPSELQDFTIVQISDIHIGPTIKGKYLQIIVDKVNQLKPDLVAITGDLVDGSVEQLALQVQPIKNLRSTYGSYFVTGNHEYYSGAISWIDYLKSLGVKVLLNQHEIITHNGTALVIAGVTDFAAQQIIPEHFSDAALAISGAENINAPKILLAHQPRSARAATAAGFDVQLSGHTHGGQFWPWNFFVRLQQPYTVGLHKVNAMWLYINRGTGYWGPPKRLGGRSEITLIRLVKA